MKAPVWMVSGLMCIALLGCHQRRADTSAAAAGVTVAHDSLAILASDQPPLGRLPTVVVPTSYRIDLQTDPAQTSFQGHVEIDLQINQSTRSFWLHGQSLQATKISIRLGDQMIPASYQQKEASGVVLINAEQILPQGKATLSIDYLGDYSAKLDGLYKVIDAGRPYLFTQFESVFARQMFPGFDEPGFKTPFSISVTIPKVMVAIGNTPIEKETNISDQWKKIQFQTTQKLPTYLLALAIGELDVVPYADIPANKIRSTPLALRGVATKGKGKLMGYALANTAKIVAELEDYFASPYPFEKLDIIAVPDFNSGAMENAGAITYREQLLLMQPDAPTFQKTSYTGTHAHELAHQWFGNLVTPAWWDDIWLNEAFATWMGIKIAGRAQPSFNFQHRIQLGAIDAMEVDALTSARKIRNEVLDKNEIVGAFDSITYRKGGGVLQMFEHYLGEERFRDGVRLHMKRYAHGNATAKDFLQSLADGANDPSVVVAFESFLTQSGVPIFDVQLNCQGQPSVTIAQQRYLPKGIAAGAAQTWTAPICIKYPASISIDIKQQCMTLDQPRQTIALNTKQCPQWLMPNANGSGYQRFVLDQGLAKAALASGALSSSEKIALNDSFSAALWSGAITDQDYLALGLSLAKDADPNVALSVLSTLRTLAQFGTTQVGNAQALEAIHQQLRQRLQAIGGVSAAPVSSNPATDELRLRLTEYLVMYANDERTILPMALLGDVLLGLEHTSPAPAPQLRDIAMAASLQVHQQPAFDALRTLLLNSNDATLRGQILKALGSAREPKIVQQVLALSLASDLRVSEILVIPSQVANLSGNRALLWTWLKANSKTLAERLPEKSHNRVIELAQGQCDSVAMADVDAYFKPIAPSLINGPRSLALTKERIARCVAFVAAPN